MQLDQAYLIVERATKADAQDWSVGGRVDLLYGADAPFTFSRDFDDKLIDNDQSRFNKLAIPQAYIEIASPTDLGLTAKIGHFYTLLGYEVVTAPDNFFYSHSYSMQYAEPFTHWGALISSKVGEDLAFSVGAVRGWDNLDDDADSNLSFLGGATYTIDENSTLVFSLISGNEGRNRNQTAYSLVYTRNFCDDFTYVAQHDYGFSEAASGISKAEWYSLNQYFIYHQTEKLSHGIRAEWFRDDDGARVAGLRSGSTAAASNYYGVSVGSKYAFTDWLTLRGELRWDWQRGVAQGVSPAFSNGTDDKQMLAALNAIVAF